MTMKETEITVGTEKCHVFLQETFFVPRGQTSVLHRHRYTELQIVRGESVTYRIGEQTVTLSGGMLVAIPQDTFHCPLSFAPHSVAIPFQITRRIEKLAICAVPQEKIDALMHAAERYLRTGDGLLLQAHLALICAYLPFFSSASITPIEDRFYLLNEYFASHYATGTLTELAAMLCVSEKQAARIVRLHTGHSFREELTQQRLYVATCLIKEGKMSLEEIAAAVGYQSYSGFWKAMTNARGCYFAVGEGGTTASKKKKMLLSQMG